MHRHGYKGRKFGRERDQRAMLMKSLADALIEHTTIETTSAKAKELVPYMEKLVTLAKKGDLASRRQILSRLHSVSNTHKLVDEIAPKLSKRSSGHFRIELSRVRRGDNVQLSRISFVDDLSTEEAPKKATPAETKKKPQKTGAAK